MKFFTLNSFTKFKIASFLVMIFVFSLSFGQNDYTIQLQDENIELPENIDSFEWNQMPESSELDNGYIGWIQFYETPSQIIQNRFRNNALQLIEYIPNKAYLFYFPNTTSVSFLKDNGMQFW